MPVLSFDVPTQEIRVAAPDLELTIQELWDKSQEFLASHRGMSESTFIFGGGKEDLGGGDFVGITVTLVDWKVKFDDRAGPSTVVTSIRGGNLVGRVGSISGSIQHPVSAADFTFNIINQSTSPALIAAPIPDESFWGVTYDEGGTDIEIVCWLERAGVLVTSGLVDATITWYNQDHSVLFTVNSTSPDPTTGHFSFTVNQILAADQAYYATVAVQDAKGIVTTEQSAPTAS